MLVKINIKIRPQTISPRLIEYGFDLFALSLAFLEVVMSENLAFGKITWPHNLSIKKSI